MTGGIKETAYNKMPICLKFMINNFTDRLIILNKLISLQDITGYIKNVWELISEANKFFNDKKPWDLKKNDENQYKNVLFVTANLIKQISILIYPVMPDASERILKILNIKEENNFQTINNVSLSGVKLNEITPLFPRIE